MSGADDMAVRENRIRLAELEAVIPRDALERLFEYLREVKYGTVTIILQDGKVVQIDKLEKLRLK
jgi:hypothetical protein